MTTSAVMSRMTIKQEKPEVFQQDVDPNIFLDLEPGESRKCKVMDILFDQHPSGCAGSNDDDDEPAIPAPEPVPGDAELGVILQKASGDAESGVTTNMVIYDPDGLKAELDTYKSETDQLRKENYQLKIKNQTLRNERKRLQKKVEIRYSIINHHNYLFQAYFLWTFWKFFYKNSRRPEFLAI